MGGSQIFGIDLPWELVRKAESQVLPQTQWNKMCI